MNNPGLCATHMLGRFNYLSICPIDSNTVYCYAHYIDRNKALLEEEPAYVLRRYFSQFGGDAKALIAAITKDTEITVGRLESLKSVQTTEESFLLVGNAAHATTPWLQQGVSQALEDVECITELMRDCTIKESLKLYKAFREPHMQGVHRASKFQQEKITDLNTPGYIHDKAMTKILQQGPLNVLGWEWIKRQDYPAELKAFLEKFTFNYQSTGTSPRPF